MGARGPHPAAKPGKTIGAHVDGDTLEALADVVYTRKRSQSFIAAEAIRLGLKEVEKLYPPVRKSKLKAAKKRPARAASSSKRSADMSGTLRRKLKASGLK
jgi:hypothetical protein